MAGDLIKNVKVQKGHVPKMFDASTSTWRPAGENFDVKSTHIILWN